MSTTLDIVRIPVLNDNYVWLMREPQSGAVGVVDPAVAGPVLAEAEKRRWKITHILNTQAAAPSLLGEEKATNPFMRADVPAVAKAVGLPFSDPVAAFAEVRRRKDAFR